MAKQITTYLNDVAIVYTDETQFLATCYNVSNPKDKNEYLITGDLAKAAFYFRGLNPGPKYVKKLIMNPKGKAATGRKVLAKVRGQVEHSY